MNMVSTVRRPRQTSAYSRAVAAEIRAEAGRQGLRQADLADSAGIPRSSFGPYWNGDRPLDVDQLERLARVLKVEVVVIATAARTNLDAQSKSQADEAGLAEAAYDPPATPGGEEVQP